MSDEEWKKLLADVNEALDLWRKEGIPHTVMKNEGVRTFWREASTPKEKDL